MGSSPDPPLLQATHGLELWLASVLFRHHRVWGPEVTERGKEAHSLESAGCSSSAASYHTLPSVTILATLDSACTHVIPADIIYLESTFARLA